MIPIRLRLSGFLSYKEAVDVDFTSFELACISGSNGAGKSSLLDAITWVLFGQARRRDDALINSHAEKAEVTFDFQYEENLYRVQRLKPRDKTTVLEFFICDSSGTWRPLTERSMRETEARIEATLRMDYETFTNASFLLQGRADQFAQQRPADRKKVLSAILGLEVWEQYRQDAMERRKVLESDQRALDVQLDEIERELAQEAERRAALADIEARLKELSEKRKQQETQMAVLQRIMTSLEDRLKNVQTLQQYVQAARRRYEDDLAEAERLRAEREKHAETIAREPDIRAAYDRWQAAIKALENWDQVAANFREIEARRSKPLTMIASEASRLDQEQHTLFAQEVSVLQQQERLPEVEQQIQTFAGGMTRIEAELAKRTALDAEIQVAQEQAARWRAENPALLAQMRELDERIKRLKTMEGAVCPWCGQPLSAEDRGRLIEETRARGTEMGDRYRANLELRDAADGRERDLKAQRAELGRLDEAYRVQVRQHDQKVTERQHIIEGAAAWADGGANRLAEVRRILAEEDFALDARAELATIDQESMALGYDAAAHDGARQAELQGRGSLDDLRRLETAQASLAPLERQLISLETRLVEDAASLSTQEEQYRLAQESYEREAAQPPDVETAERELFTLHAEENRARMELGGARQAVAVLQTQKERRKRFQAQRDALNIQITRLKTLEHAFSKDGVPALLIEQALPELEVQANDILDRLSNGAMSVRFVTQRSYRDKSREDRKETLDIIISDGAGERDYEMFSGGEAFRVNFAIRLALSRVLAQRAGARLQMLVIDEGFGSQDADGRQRLIEAINMVRPDFAKILIITHLEELKEAFPARIEVEKSLTGSQVRVVTA